MVHPGPDTIEKAGGIHKFINYNKPIITDSGGFQVFSLSDNTGMEKELKGSVKKQYREGATVLKVNEEGVLFRSYRDGRPIFLTPESSVAAQKKIGADIIVPLDWLLPNCVDTVKLKKALEITHSWEARSLIEHIKNINKQAMYGIIHGGSDAELRRLSAQYISALPFQGIAVGGSLGKDTQEMKTILEQLNPHLPPSLPRHLLGIGDIPGIMQGVINGMDTFDSCLPTRLGRHGTLLTEEGELKIKRGIYKELFEPLVDDPNHPFFNTYTKASLHHLFKQNEPAASTIGTIHNIYMMMQYMRKIRSLIQLNLI
uniref:tRNA-guanine(15) transglycosylase-like domain-containing protein n=1 Tax=Arcella intermedia TaxID=1963864 RepID=A0A6B2L680_9EUKA